MGAETGAKAKEQTAGAEESATLGEDIGPHFQELFKGLQ
jgi:hypothetical protein